MIKMDKKKAKVFAKKFFDAMEKQNGFNLDTPKGRFEAVQKSPFRIDDILEPSLDGFKNLELQKKYLEDLKRLGATPADYPPTAWAKLRKGEHAEILRKSLGNNYAGVMRFIEQGRGTNKKVIVRIDTVKHRFSQT